MKLGQRSNSAKIGQNYLKLSQKSRFISNLGRNSTRSTRNLYIKFSTKFDIYIYKNSNLSTTRVLSPRPITSYKVLDRSSTDYRVLQPCIFYAVHTPLQNKFWTWEEYFQNFLLISLRSKFSSIFIYTLIDNSLNCLLKT